MKKNILFAVLTILGAGMLSPSMAQSYLIEDDIYYTPGDENAVIEQKKKEKAQKVETVTTVTTTTTTTSAERDVDEYNRRGASYENYYDEEAADGTVTGTTYTYYSDEVAPGDTLYIQPEEGYYLNDFEGSLSDYEYTVRIHRFYDPRFAISISDPGYTDIYFLDSNDWNVYIDGTYAWVTPTWTNPWYWNYTWAPYSYSSWAWRWNYGWTSWGYYNPWAYTAWGYPYYGWGSPYHYGWHHYYGWGGYPYYGWHHHHHGHHNWYGHNYPNGRGPREWRSSSPARPDDNKVNEGRYGGSYVAGNRDNSNGAPGRRESIDGTGSRGTRYTTTSRRETIERSTLNNSGRRGTATVNTGGRRQSINDDGTNVNSTTRRGASSNDNKVRSNSTRRGSTSVSNRTGSSSSRTSINSGSSSRRSSSSSSYNSSRGSSSRGSSYNSSRGSSSSRSSYNSSRGSSSRGSSYSPSRGSSSRGSSSSSSRGSSGGGGGRGRR